MGFGWGYGDLDGREWVEERLRLWIYLKAMISLGRLQKLLYYKNVVIWSLADSL